MSLNITETDREEYDALECKNISLETFVRHRIDDIEKIARFNNKYKKTIKYRGNSRSIKEYSSLSGIIPGSVRRTIIIDGANIMHCGSTYHDLREGTSQNIPDVAALLAVLRFFVARDFEVFAVISKKYAKPNATNFKEGIEELVKSNLCIIVPPTNLDDTIALEFASQLNGVVVTSDQYRDHAEENDRFKKIVNDHRLGIDWEKLKSPHQNTRGGKNDGDYTPQKLFIFTNESAEMNEHDVIKTVYSDPLQLQYFISKERYEMIQPTNKKIKVLSILDDLIVRGLSVYDINYEAILETPVHVPSEHLQTSHSDPDMSFQELPPDDQSDYIATLSLDDEEDEW